MSFELPEALKEISDDVLENFSEIDIQEIAKNVYEKISSAYNDIGPKDDFITAHKFNKIDFGNADFLINFTPFRYVSQYANRNFPIKLSWKDYSLHNTVYILDKDNLLKTLFDYLNDNYEFYNSELENVIARKLCLMFLETFLIDVVEAYINIEIKPENLHYVGYTYVDYATIK